jgi:AraC family transcriptional regulator
MTQVPDIWSAGHQDPLFGGETDLLVRKEKQIPGTWEYQILRYRMQPQWTVEDRGQLVYHHPGKGKPYLELKYCISGNTYCRDKAAECNSCRMSETRGCEARIPTVDLLQFRFEASHLSQYVKGRKQVSFTDDVLRFRHKHSFTQVLPICGKIRGSLEAILNNEYTDTLENIFVNAQTQILLLYSMDCLMGEKGEGPAGCKFLSNEADREKIARAREVLIQHIGDPITIRELSRKVAINECYLKKGFKEMFGTTIFDFYQNQRMEHARFLLYEKGLSVSEVSLLLGYSSISHFSTAFKKHTGLKPCELLIRQAGQ